MKPDLIVVSSYPRTGTLRGRDTVGVADYTKQTLISLPKHLNILVLAEKLKDEPLIATEGNIQVIRCWQRNHPLSLFSIFFHIIKSPTRKVLFEFEMAMLGDPWMNFFFVNLLLLLKIFQKKVFIVLHQVVLDFNEISGHIGQKKNSHLNTLLNLFAKIFYRLIVLFSYRIIIFEQFLKDRLDKNNSKIIVIPHGVEISNKRYNFDEANNFSESLSGAKSPEGKRDPRSGSPEVVSTAKIKLSNCFTITIFGYLAWYKGTDWLVETFVSYFDHHSKSKLKLIVAGGPNPNHLDKPYYQEYLSKLNSTASKHPQNIQITGFVDEKDIEKYYQESDLIILPYRVGMSSSGPLSIAFTHHKAFFVSDKIAPILNTSDISTIFKKHSLSPKIASFPLSSPKLLQKIIHLKKDFKLQKELGLISQEISSARSWNNISKQYLTCLNL